LPRVGNKFDPDDIREMLRNALPLYVQTIIATPNYKWFNKHKTNSKVSSYFDRLLVIGSMVRGKKPKSAHQPIAHKKHDDKKCKFNKKKLTRKHSKRENPRIFFAATWGTKNFSANATSETLP
jgi:hypothetical protein